MSSDVKLTSSSSSTTSSSNHRASSKVKSGRNRLTHHGKHLLRYRARGRPPGIPKKSSTSSSNTNSSQTFSTIPANCPWQVGQRVEACDPMGHWYPAKIIEIKDFQVLIHFQRWSTRYDQWFDMDSNLIRHKKEESTNHNTPLEFDLNDFVLAKWSDSQMYPAQIVKIFNDKLYCTVLFYDGYKKKLRLNTLQKLPEDYEGERLPPKPEPKQKFNQVVDPINHNDFVCNICKKGFRKEILLKQHNKHYHNAVDTLNSVTTSTITDSTCDMKTQQNETAPTKVTPDDLMTVAVNEENDSKKTTITVDVKSEQQDSESSVSLGDIVDVKVSTEKIVKESLGTKRNESSNIDAVTTTIPPVSKTDTTTLSGKKRKNGKTDSRKNNNTSETPSSTKRVRKSLSGNLLSSTYYYNSRTSQRPAKGNTVLPFSDAKSIAETHEDDNIDEIVKCICPNSEENGLMVQCELCLCWQHAQCMEFKSEADVPDDGYFCPFCRSPKKAVKSQINSYQLNHWLKNALAPAFSPNHFTPLNTEVPVTQPSKSETTFNTMVPVPEVWPNVVSSNVPTFNDILPTTGTNPGVVNFGTHSIQSNVVNSIGTPAIIGNIYGDGSESASKTSLATAANEFDMPPSNMLDGFNSNFDDEADTKKNNGSNFMLNEFGNSIHSNGADLNLMEDLIDINLKDDYFPETKLPDEEEQFSAQVKAVNMLSAALVDVLNNLHSLNFRIKHHGDIAYPKISEKQKLLKKQLQLIEAKLEKAEKEIDMKDSYAIHTSSSTLTATSPENFGNFNDSNVSSTSAAPFQQPTTSSTQRVTFSSSLFDNAHNSSTMDSLNAPSSGIEQTLSSLNSSMPQISQLSTINLANTNIFNFLTPKSDDGILLSTGAQASPKLSGSSSLDSSGLPTQQPLCRLPTASGTTSTQTAPPGSLARLYIPPVSNASSTNELAELIRSHRPSMSYEYLPPNMTDAELKMELACHYKDLATARQIVLSLK